MVRNTPASLTLTCTQHLAFENEPVFSYNYVLFVTWFKSQDFGPIHTRKFFSNSVQPIKGNIFPSVYILKVLELSWGGGCWHEFGMVSFCVNICYYISEKWINTKIYHAKFMSTTPTPREFQYLKYVHTWKKYFLLWVGPNWKKISLYDL